MSAAAPGLTKQRMQAGAATAAMPSAAQRVGNAATIAVDASARKAVGVGGSNPDKTSDTDTRSSDEAFQDNRGTSHPGRSRSMCYTPTWVAS